MTSVSLNFASDNCGPAHPDIMAAVLASNDGHHKSYGADAMTQAVTAELRRIFEAPQAAVYLVATGTAANTLALSCYTKPWDAIFCHRESHVETDECGAPEFYSGGAKLSLVDGPDRKMRAANLTQAMEHSDGSVHQAQLGPISVTQATEAGTLYSCAEIEALCKIAKDRGSACHLDGARFANACVALDCTPAEMTWKAGIDAVSFGGTKNGCLAVEAVVLFDPDRAWEFELRRKRAAHLFSKHRFLAAQMQGYLADGLWLRMARSANTTGGLLTRGLKQHPDIALTYEPEVNMIFAEMPRELHQRARAGGALYTVYGNLDSGPMEERLNSRMVCDWSKTEADIEAMLGLLR